MDIVHRNESTGASDSPQLVERMDSAIGEASTSIGMIMSELVRRSLRGGVGEIGASIHDYARDRVCIAVTEAVSDAMPRIEQTVELIAETTSTRITDVAVNRIGEELKSVETRTAEKTEVFAARIKADTDTALENVHRVIGESRESSEKTSQELRDLQVRAKDSWKKVQLELQNVNDARARLEQRLQEAEGRLTVSQQQLNETDQRLDQATQENSLTREQLTNTSRQVTETRNAFGRSQQELLKTQQELMQTQQQLDETQSGLNATQNNLSELRRATSERALMLESFCGSLAKRLEDLERPKGIRALFSRFTGNAKKPTASASNVDREVEE